MCVRARKCASDFRKSGTVRERWSCVLCSWCSGSMLMYLSSLKRWVKLQFRFRAEQNVNILDIFDKICRFRSDPTNLKTYRISYCFGQVLVILYIVDIFGQNRPFSKRFGTSQNI